MWKRERRVKIELFQFKAFNRISWLCGYIANGMKQWSNVEWGEKRDFYSVIVLVQDFVAFLFTCKASFFSHLTRQIFSWPLTLRNFHNLVAIKFLLIIFRLFWCFFLKSRKAILVHDSHDSLAMKICQVRVDGNKMLKSSSIKQWGNKRQTTMKQKKQEKKKEKIKT